VSGLPCGTSRLCLLHGSVLIRLLLYTSHQLFEKLGERHNLIAPLLNLGNQPIQRLRFHGTASVQQDNPPIAQVVHHPICDRLWRRVRSPIDGINGQ
jgi:hypothetical protein